MNRERAEELWWTIKEWHGSCMVRCVWFLYIYWCIIYDKGYSFFFIRIYNISMFWLFFFFIILSLFVYAGIYSLNLYCYICIMSYVVGVLNHFIPQWGSYGPCLWTSINMFLLLCLSIICYMGRGGVGNCNGNGH